MTKPSTFKNKLVITTAITAALFGYGRRAYAACTGPAPNYTCSGSNSSTLGFIADDSHVITSSGFSVTTAAGDAINISGDGALSFTDVHTSASTITGYNNGLVYICQRR
jgi:hypothetical protein